MSNSLQPHESQHARPPCPSPTPGVHPDSRPLTQWCHPAISSSVVPFSSCPQSLPPSESFPMSQLFTWGGQSTKWSFSFSIFPSKEIPGLISFRMDWLDLLAVQGTLKSLLQHGFYIYIYTSISYLKFLNTNLHSILMSSKRFWGKYKCFLKHFGWELSLNMDYLQEEKYYSYEIMTLLTYLQLEIVLPLPLCLTTEINGKNFHQSIPWNC